MSDGNGNPSKTELADLVRRLEALEVRMERELPLMRTVVERANEFHTRLNERLDLMQQLLAVVASSKKNGDAAAYGKPVLDSMMGEDDLDAKILALRNKLQSTE